MTAITFFKVLDPGRKARNGGTGTWPEPGQWTEDTDPIPCYQGWHLCREDQVLGWLGPEIWLAEGRGAQVEAGDKVVFESARLIRKLEGWNEKTARLFAADCAERVLPVFEADFPGDDRPRKAIEVARAYANGEATRAELAAAESAAAWDAAWAAWAAAWAAARDAAWAAWAAAWAARAAARAAAWDAAWDAEGQWQYERFLHYVKED